MPEPAVYITALTIELFMIDYDCYLLLFCSVVDAH